MKLKNFLKSRKMNIQQLADGLAMPHETVRHYVHGTRNPKIDNAYKIIAFTEGLVSLGDIYRKPKSKGASI